MQYYLSNRSTPIVNRNCRSSGCSRHIGSENGGWSGYRWFFRPRSYVLVSYAFVPLGILSHSIINSFGFWRWLRSSGGFFSSLLFFLSLKNNSTRKYYIIKEFLHLTSSSSCAFTQNKKFEKVDNFASVLQMSYRFKNSQIAIFVYFHSYTFIQGQKIMADSDVIMFSSPKLLLRSNYLSQFFKITQ